MKFFTRIISSLFLFISVGTQAKEAALADTIRLSLHFKTDGTGSAVEPRRIYGSASSGRDSFDICIEGWDATGGHTDTVSRKDIVVICHNDTIYAPPEVKRPEAPPLHSPYRGKAFRRPALAFRSNLLMPLLNIGAECPINNRWSVAADFYYPWCPREWTNKWYTPQMTCIQGLGGFVEGRYWFGIQHREDDPDRSRYRLLGHSLGLLAGGAYYDVELKGNGRQGELIAMGIGYAYVIPLGKKGGVHLGFDVAVGTVYHVWHPFNVFHEGGYLMRQKDESNVGILSRRSWSFLPIKAGINLSVPIFGREQNGKEAL